MPNNNLLRTNADIARVLDTLLRDIKDPRVKNQGMISITAVETSADLRHAKIFLSVFGLQSEKDLIKGLKSASGYLRKQLGQSLSLRMTPELQFELDDSLERGARIGAILNDLGVSDDDEPADKEQDDDYC